MNTVTATYDVDDVWQVFTAVDRTGADVAAPGSATVNYAVGLMAPARRRGRATRSRVPLA